VIRFFEARSGSEIPNSSAPFFWALDLDRRCEVWRMKRRSIAREEPELLETDEQLELIQSLKSEATRQSSIVRTIFFFLFSALGIVFVFLFFQFSLDPWWIAHQEIFQFSLPSYIFLIFYAISISVSFSSGLICFYGRTDKLKVIWNVLAVVSFIIMCLWIKIFQDHSITSPLLYWMPFGNITCLLLALYTDHEMVTLVSDVRILDTLVYSFKGA
jgi:uncharacterized membrane protein